MDGLNVADSNKVINLLEVRNINKQHNNNNSIPAPPPCQVEEQVKTKSKKKVKFETPPPPTKNKTTFVCWHKQQRLIKKKKKMEEQERELAHMREHMTKDEASRELAQAYNFVPKDTAEEPLTSIISEWCNNIFDTPNTSVQHNCEQSEREGVLNGTIASGIADSGTTATCGILNDEKYFENTGEVSDKTFIVANGIAEPATEVMKLPFEQLRDEARRVDMVPGINTATLISTGKLADANYISIFDDEEVNIYDANNTKIVTTRGAVLRGYRDKSEGVYRIPLVKEVKNINTDTAIVNVPPNRFLQQNPPSYDTINNVWECRNQSEVLRFYHAACGFPTEATWIQAVERGYFASWPGLTVAAIRRHFPESEETQKGHMKAIKSGIRSTKKKLIKEVVKIEDDNEVPNKVKSKQREVCVRILDTRDELQMKIYTDQTGKFPRKSSRGNQYIMVLFEVDSNAILVAPMASRSKGEMVKAYQSLIDRLNARGIFPKKHMLDNEISDELEDCIAKNHITFQHVPPTNHRANAAERAIQTFKAHFISTLCGCDESFPLHLWCRLLPQVEMTMNMLRPSRTTPNVSAYAHLHGQHDYNAHPLTPLGVQVEMHVMPGNRGTFAPHSVSGFCIGTSFKHYRCYEIYVKDTRSVRVGNTVFFKHKYLTMPTITNADALLKSAKDMKTAFEGGVAQSSEVNDAMKTVVSIFQKNAEDAKAREEAARPQRVRMREAAERRRQLEEEHAQAQRVEDIEDENEEEVAIPPTQPVTTSTVPSLEVIYPTTDGDKVPENEEAPPLITQDDSIYNGDSPATNTRARRRATTTITQEALLHTLDVARDTVKVTPRRLASRKFPLALLCVFAGAVLDGATGEMLEYRHLIKHPLHKRTWGPSFSKEVGRLAQGIKGVVEGTDTIFFIPYDQIPADRIKDVTYEQIVCNIRPEKDDPYRTRLVAGGNLLNCPFDTGTPTADIITVKLLLNSIVSTPGAKFMGIDIKNFYLNTPMERYQYMRMKLSNFPQDLIDEYKLLDIERNGCVYVEIRKGMYGLPEAGILAQQLLEERLKKKGYTQSEYTPGFWTHEWRPISFALTVDDFAVKYVGKEHAQHLLSAIEEHYECKADWEGTRYIGLTLDWDYDNREVHISMPGYVAEALERFHHETPKKPQHQPHPHVKPAYGQKIQYEHVDESEPLSKEEKKFVQQVTGTFLYYARAVDPI